MKARLGLVSVLVVWLVVILSPALRETWLVQMTGRSPLYPGPGHVPFYSIHSWQPPVETLQTQFSDEPKALTVALFLRSLQESAQPDSLPKACDELDKIIARSPDQPWLMAARLRWTLQWMQHNRLAGELSDPDLARRRARGLPSPEKVSGAPNFSPRQLQAALDVARRGGQLEPGNAFWDWMAAQLNVYGWRDGAAWNALEIGAGKRLYDAHEREWQEALLWSHQAMLGRALLVEEKDFLRRNYATALLGGRGIGRLVTWQAVKAERRGEHRTALRILTSFCQLQVLRARQSYAQRECYLATMLAVFPLGRSLSWSATAPGAGWSMEREARWRGNGFTSYAAAHGQGELARRVVASVRALAHAQEQALQQTNTAPEVEGARAASMALSTYGAMNTLWQQAALCGALWLALSALFYGFGLPRVATTPSDGVFGIGLVATVIVALSTGAGSQIADLGANVFAFPLASRPGQHALYDAASLILPACTALPVLFITVLVQGLTLWRVSSGERMPSWPQRSRHERSWRERWGQARPTPFVVIITLGLFTLAMLVWWQIVLNSSDMSLFVPRELAGLPLGPLGGRAIALAAVHPNWPLCAMLLGLVAGWVRWIFAAPPQHRSVVLYRLSWLHQLLGAAVLLCSVLYVATGFSAVTARRTAEREFQQVLARGDNTLRQ